ncbi:MAG: DUF305 domain-containing protein [Aeromicrobium sp.]
MRIKTILSTAAAVVALVGLTACSDENGDTSASCNEADVSFAQDMIPHHQQALEMGKLADGRTKNPEVLDLAAKIVAAQQPEIQTMTGWLKAWKKDVPDGSMSGMDHGDMPGMMSGSEMTSLEDASDDQFDQKFLAMMIMHHEGAIEMATQEVENGKYSNAVTLAEKIKKDQLAEIATMRRLLSS